MKISIFGAGYVGLVTSACFAEMGNEVICVDVDTSRIAELKRGQMPIYEPGLQNLVAQNVKLGHLRFSSDMHLGIEHGDVLFIAVGTPSDQEGSADLQHVLAVASSIGRHMLNEKVVVDKSTVPVGTADTVRDTIAAELRQRCCRLNFHVVSNPEFLKEGAAIGDFMKPDRIIVGSDSPLGARTLEQLYAPFNRNHDKIVHMDVRSAELTKYAANVMLATRISLMNELANLADRLHADIEAVRRGVGMDHRIGYHFIYPGTGYGGSCFPKDVRALIRSAESADYDAAIARSVEKVNNQQKRVLFDKCIDHFNGSIRGHTFALWGLSFKPNTGDMREAPSRTIIDMLLAAGARVRAYDPQANAEAQRLYGNYAEIEICDDRSATLIAADGLFVLTEWNEFRSPDFKRIRDTMKQAVLFDGRNLYDPDYLLALGFCHYAIGRNRAMLG